MQLPTALTALLASTTSVALASPSNNIPATARDFAPHGLIHIHENATSVPFPLTPSNFNITTADADSQLTRRDKGTEWDDKKIVIWTYTKKGNSCSGHAAQSKHNLKPFKCKNFGWFDRFTEVQFKLPDEVHEEGIQCEITFYDDDGCQGGDESGKVQNDDEKPKCQNTVGYNMLPKKSAMPKCYKPN